MTAPITISELAIHSPFTVADACEALGYTRDEINLSVPEDAKKVAIAHAHLSVRWARAVFEEACKKP